MKYARAGLVISAAIAGLAMSVSSARAQTTTVAAFFDPSFTSNNTPMFFRTGAAFTGGWGGMGLTLFTPGLPAPDYTDVTFTMTPLAVVGGAYPQETLSGGQINFFDNMSAPLLTLSFSAAHLSPFGFGAADFFLDNVVFSGPLLTGIGAVSSNEQFGFSFANLVGDPTSNYSVTASFTSSAVIVIPAPASAALLGVAGLVAGRRRR